jgi:hypothetical protein
LISSASTRLAKIGPASKRNADRFRALVIDLGAGDVGRQQVGRELDAGKVAIEVLRQRLDRAGLGEPRQALDQQVAIGQKADQQPLDHRALADDRVAHPVAQGGDLRGRRLGLGRICRRAARTGPFAPGCVHLPLRKRSGARSSCAHFGKRASGLQGSRRKKTGRPRHARAGGRRTGIIDDRAMRRRRYAPRHKAPIAGFTHAALRC